MRKASDINDIKSVVGPTLLDENGCRVGTHVTIRTRDGQGRRTRTEVSIRAWRSCFHRPHLVEAAEICFWKTDVATGTSGKDELNRGYWAWGVDFTKTVRLAELLIANGSYSDAEMFSVVAENLELRDKFESPDWKSRTDRYAIKAAVDLLLATWAETGSITDADAAIALIREHPHTETGCAQARSLELETK